MKLKNFFSAKYDLAIIGGGPGVKNNKKGYVAAIKAG